MEEEKKEAVWHCQDYTAMLVEAIDIHGELNAHLIVL